MDDFCSGCGTAFEEEDRFCSKCGNARGGTPGPPEPKPTHKPTTGDRVRGTATIVILVGIFGLVPLCMMFGGGSVEGELTVQASPYGDFTFTPTGCVSMQPFGRMGANIHGEGPNDGALYVTLDPSKGTKAEVEVPGSCKQANGTDCTVFELPREACTRFELEVDFNGVTVNDVRQVEGHASLDCKLPDGTRVHGEITFDGC